MHYFALVNIDGLQQLIDAMGGMKLNVNRKLPSAATTRPTPDPTAG